MQFLPKLSEENIKRMCNKYLLDMVEAGHYKIINGTFYIQLNYWSENEYHPTAKFYGQIDDRKITEFKLWFKELLKDHI